MVESEKTAIAKQQLVETRFRSNKYPGINQRVAQRLTPFARQWLPKMHSHVNEGSTEVFVDTGNLGITRRFSYNGYAE
jgi:hypothetical protein